MLNDITIGQHYPSNSVIHKLDSTIKLIATFVFMVSLFIINSIAITVKFDCHRQFLVG